MNTVVDQTICKASRCAGGRALLVGGCVRDWLLGREPEHVGVVGVVCASAELEVRLTPEVAAGLPAAVDAAAEVLERWASD